MSSALKNNCIETTQAFVTYELNLCFCSNVIKVCVSTAQVYVYSRQVFFD